MNLRKYHQHEISFHLKKNKKKTNTKELLICLGRTSFILQCLMKVILIHILEKNISVISYS